MNGPNEDREGTTAQEDFAYVRQKARMQVDKKQAEFPLINMQLHGVPAIMTINFIDWHSDSPVSELQAIQINEAMQRIVKRCATPV